MGVIARDLYLAPAETTAHGVIRCPSASPSYAG
jgi:hypothetical protein